MRFCTGALPLFSLLLIVQVACSKTPEVDQAAIDQAADADHAEHAGQSGIAWFEGDVDQAFALAKQENKPLFLYWGAVWCPPCHYLKTKVFSRPEFIAQSRAFIPVYLDGDTERAQILGERYQTTGYPTVILFNPAGQEITRLLSTLPVERYRVVLELAMARMRPIKEILADVVEIGPADANPIDLNLLAFYSWGQDRAVQIPADDRLAIFRTLYQDTPETASAERSRFLTLYLGELIQQHNQDEAAELGLDDENRSALHDAVVSLLADPEMRSLNLDLLFYMSRETVDLLHPSPDSEARNALVDAWKSAARSAEDDTSLTVDDQLSALFPQLWLTKGSNSEDSKASALPEELKSRVRDRIAWASQTVTDEGELQAVMSTMAALLEEASLSAEAETLLTDRLADTVAPYYFMSWIAGIKAEAGQTDEALEWYRKAYDNASGRYTRFRWGSSYLRQRMKLAPDDPETLEKETVEILGELLTFDDAFAGGNHSRLEQLATAYQKWNQDGQHDALVDRVRNLVHTACERYPNEGETDQGDRCLAFLQPEDISAS